MEYLLILLAQCSALTESFLIKIYNKKHAKGGFIFTAMISLCSMLFFLFKELITDKTGLTFRAEIIPYAVAAGLCYCIASLCSFFVLRYGPYALSLLILSYSLVITTGYGLIFLGEPLTPIKCVAFVLIAVSIFFVKYERKKKEPDVSNAPQNDKNGVSLIWAVCLILDVALAGMYGVIQRMQQIRFENSVTGEFMVLTLSLSAALLFIAGAVKDGRDCGYIFRHGTPYAAGAGFANGFTNAMILIVYSLLPISVVAPTGAGLKMLLSFMISIFILKEKFRPLQVVGVVLGTAAVILLNIK